MGAVRKRVLFLCVNNACRSQMAEALVNALRGDEYEVFSAGSEPTRVHPMAVKVMAEIGIDMTGHRSKHVSEFAGQEFDYVVTVCSETGEACPFFPGKGERIHAPFPDPAAAKGREEHVVREFRRVRDLLKEFVLSFPQVPDRRRSVGWST